MEIRFKSANGIIEDLIDSDENMIELIGWSSNEPVTIKNWKFINFKRPPSTITIQCYKWIYFNQITFINCTFKDINFMGGVPMDRCDFKNCTFENCMLTDHIRWNTFTSCKFNFCLFAGYFHENKFSASCKYDKVLLSCYGNIYKSLKNGATCTKSERLEILKYFYSQEATVYDEFKKGDSYFAKKFKFEGFKKEMDKLTTHEINGEKYYKDIVKEIDFNLNSYKPEVRIVGKKYCPLYNECLPIK